MRPWPTSSTPPRKGVFPLLAGLLVLSALASICLGPVPLSPRQVIAVLTGRETGTVTAHIILLARLPRTLGCLLAGCALAVAGCTIQGVLGNPLAAPNIVGVNAGAGLGVALLSAAAPGLVNGAPLAAFLGALGGVLLVLGLSERTGASRITVVLAGVTVSSLFSACVDTIVTLVPDALMGYSDFRIGGLQNVTMARILPAAWVILPALALLLVLAPRLDVLLLGADVAQSLGVRVKPLRLLLLALAAALAGAAVSFAGLLGFLGLLVPHIARRLVGENSFPLLLACALGGGGFLTLCDLLARLLFAPAELPVGIVLSLAGGPFFLWLLLHERGGRRP